MSHPVLLCLLSTSHTVSARAFYITHRTHKASSAQHLWGLLLSSTVSELLSPTIRFGLLTRLLPSTISALTCIRLRARSPAARLSGTALHPFGIAAMVGPHGKGLPAAWDPSFPSIPTPWLWLSVYMRGLMIYASSALVIRIFLWEVGEEETNLSRQSWELYLNLWHLKQSQVQAVQLKAGRLSPLSTPASVSLEGRLTLPSWTATANTSPSETLISRETKMPTGAPKSADAAKRRMRFFFARLCVVHVPLAQSK